MFRRIGQAAIAALLALGLWAGPAAALDLFQRHEVTVQFATRDGKPLADAEVRVFAPGRPDAPVQPRPVLTGRTDKSGKFEFPAAMDGLWSAEARTGDEIARVMIRVGGATEGQRLSPLWLIGGLLLLLAAALGYRFMHTRRPPP